MQGRAHAGNTGTENDCLQWIHRPYLLEVKVEIGQKKIDKKNRQKYEQINGPFMVVFGTARNNISIYIVTNVYVCRRQEENVNRRKDKSLRVQVQIRQKTEQIGVAQGQDKDGKAAEAANPQVAVQTEVVPFGLCQRLGHIVQAAQDMCAQEDEKSYCERVDVDVAEAGHGCGTEDAVQDEKNEYGRSDQSEKCSHRLLLVGPARASTAAGGRSFGIFA